MSRRPAPAAPPRHLHRRPRHHPALCCRPRRVSLVYTPRDPLEMSMDGRLEGPSRGAPARHRPVRARSPLAGHGRRGDLDHGRRHRRRHRHGRRRRARDAVRLLRRLARRGLHAADGRRPGLPRHPVGAARSRAVFRPSVVISMVAIGVAFLPIFARLTRASFLELRDREFVTAARALGAGDAALIGRHILPEHASRRSSCRRPSASRSPSWPRPRCPTSGSAPSRPTLRGGSCSGRPRPSWALSPWFAIFPGTAIASDCARLQPAWRRAQGSPRSEDDGLARLFTSEKAEREIRTCLTACSQ